MYIIVYKRYDFDLQIQFLIYMYESLVIFKNYIQKRSKRSLSLINGMLMFTRS